MASRRLTKEYQEILSNPIPNLSISLENDSLYTWQLLLSGPSDSCYSGGKFKVKMVFSTDYPFKPPTISFKTRIYHPNVSTEEGNICLAMIKVDEWKPATKITTLLTALVHLVRNPNPDDALESSIAQVYKSDMEQYKKNVKEWIKKYSEK